LKKNDIRLSRRAAKKKMKEVLFNIYYLCVTASPREIYL